MKRKTKYQETIILARKVKVITFRVQHYKYDDYAERTDILTFIIRKKPEGFIVSSITSSPEGQKFSWENKITSNKQMHIAKTMKSAETFVKSYCVAQAI